MSPRSLRFLLVLVMLVVSSVPAYADLTTFTTFTGMVGYSADGLATSTGSGTISASVPVGSTVLAAYLYGASFGDASGAVISGTLNGMAVAYGPFVENPSLCCDNGMRRADVTGIVKPIIDAGPGGMYDFTVTEDNSGSQDGESLVVVFSNPALPVSTVAILDGFSAAGGDTFFANFADPLDPTAPGFLAELALGISFSCGDPNCGTVQSSNVTVNGTLISENAGNYDDSDVPPPGNAANGRLLTTGGFNDPFSALLPSYADDHERYNVVPQISMGDTTITVNTNNPTFDDNIYLAVFHVTGEASVVTQPIPEPSTYVLFASGLVALLLARKRMRG